MTVNPTPFGRPRFNIYGGMVKGFGTVIAAGGGVDTVTGLSAVAGSIVAVVAAVTCTSSRQVEGLQSLLLDANMPTHMP